MNRFVVDASVAMKWLSLFAMEPFVDRAKRLLDRGAAGEIRMLVPDLFWLEVGSVLCKAVRRCNCDVIEANEALVKMQQLPLKTASSVRLVNSAQRIAIQYGRSIYDSLYVALAKASDSQLVTADEKLANTLAAHQPVKWLGSL
ncbi:MAG: type II toxin-antitoxin system VapC family toxin [Candidatus Acidiferrum sp.]